jgi:hypothetical protein
LFRRAFTDWQPFFPSSVSKVRQLYDAARIFIQFTECFWLHLKEQCLPIRQRPSKQLRLGASMKTRIFSLLIVAALLGAQLPTAFAQTSQPPGGNWSAVQAMATDERLIVRQKDGKRIEGKMIEASETNLTLSRNNKVVNISRDSIQQIQHVRGKAAKTKWALIGAGIGGAAGAGIGAAKASSIIDDGEIYVLAGAVIGAGAGAVGGALFGASRRQRTVIYEAP